MTVAERESSEPALEAYELLQRVNYTLDTYSRNTLRGHGLTVPQFMILRYATPEGVPLNTISARMLCDSSNLTGIVDRLTAEGFVERIVDHNDRRVRLIRLTPKGAEKLRSIGPRHHATISSRIRALPADQVEQLRNILDDLYTRLQSDGGA
jgi:MarR family transcriptional regulator, 2-MHQ and catechol-resistance regulon repressor